MEQFGEMAVILLENGRFPTHLNHLATSILK